MTKDFHKLNAFSVFLLSCLLLFFVFTTAKAQYCFPVPNPNDEDPSCDVNPNDSSCSMGIYGGQENGECDLQNTDFTIVNAHVTIIRRSDGTGGQNLTKIKHRVEEMVSKFAEMGIMVSVQGIDYINNTTIYDYEDYDLNVSQLTALFNAKVHAGAVEIYFCGPDVFDGGIALSPKETILRPGCIIGGGTDWWGDYYIDGGILLHEMGHVFGLLHTFQVCPDEDEDCLAEPTNCSCGDFVSDTNYDVFTASQLDAIDVNSCGIDAVEFPPSEYPELIFNAPFTNPMSYYPGQCLDDFTEGQRRRMKRYLANCSRLASVIDNINPIQILEGTSITVDFDGHYPFPDLTPCLPGFIVSPGATLNINSDLQFSTSAKILVKAGGRLNVNGVTLPTCGDEWTGIEVEGNSGLGQFPTTNQGRVNLYEGTVLEYARKPLYVSGGGIVLADETIFSNCGTSTFNSYPKPSFSRFTDCQFVNDDDDINFQFTSNVFLAGINGVQFSNCDFDVSGISSIFSGSDRPTGISALNARFGVGTGSSFTGYYTGIRAIGVGSKVSVGFNVNGASFSDNFIGIDNSNVDNATIRSCTFSNIGGYSGSISATGVKPVGVQLKNCTAFQVTDNNFSGSAADYEIGILAYNTGSDVNILRRNTFSGLYTANQAELKNVSLVDFTGLQYWCNTNSSTRFDFAVFDSGIGKEQGTGLASKNVFSYYNSVYGDFKNESSGDINYYYRDATNEEPLNYFNITPSEVSIPVSCIDIIDHTESDGVLDGSDEDFLDSVFTTVKATYLTQLSTYNSLHGNSTAIAMEPGLAAQKAVLHVVADRIIRSELSDTTEIDLDNIRTWLRKKESRKSEYGIVEAWLSESDSAHAIQVLDSIPRKYLFSAIDSAQHGLYKDWVLLRLGFEREEKSIYKLDSLDILDVEDIAEADTVSLASSQARALLDGIYGYDYRIHPRTATNGGSGIMAPPSNGNIAISQSVEMIQVIAFPNPARDVVKFKYKSNKIQDVGWLTIYDINGRMVAQLTLPATDNSVEWKTEGLSAGVYYYVLAGVANQPKKLVLIK